MLLGDVTLDGTSSLIGRVVKVEESIDPATLSRIVAALDGGT